jgi:hypothetical protein
MRDDRTAAARARTPGRGDLLGARERLARGDIACIHARSARDGCCPFPSPAPEKPRTAQSAAKQ